MRRRDNDILLGLVLALALHLVPLVVLVLAAWFAPAAVSSAGDPVQADVVALDALSASTRSALQRDPTPPLDPVPPQPQPLPEETAAEQPPLPDALPEEAAERQPEAQDQLPTPDRLERDEVRADSDSPQSAPQEQDAKRRQGQVDLTAQQRQDRMQQDDNEMQRQRREQLEDIRRQREALQREAELSQQRLQQIADARARAASAQAAAATTPANPPPGNGGQSRNLLGAYQMALQQAIRSNWTRPDNVPLRAVCKIVIRQIPGGTVIDAQVDPSCPYDEPGRRSVEAAVLKAQPLPYQGFESVFARTVTLNFRAEDP